MRRRSECRTWTASLLAATLAGWVAGGATVHGGEVVLASDASRPLSPEESAKRFAVPKGFHVELVAAEPLLADPTAMAFDARGRIFVCEIHGYNLEGYLDALAQNETGVLDKAVRRIPANPDAIRQAAGQQYGTVKLLEDEDGDGRMDRAMVWADRLPPCYGVVPVREGVIVFCAPDIVYLADRDGDGKAEVRTSLFTGFGVGELWTRINNPRWSVDNWIYGVPGAGSGGVIRGANLGEEVRLAAVCFRFKPDGSVLEPCTGRTSGFGQAISDWGERFLCTNQQHALLVAPLDYRYLARNPCYAAPNPMVNISSYGHPARVYPTSQPDPWRLARSKDPAWVKFYGEAEATANGYFTAASGPVIYRAAQFPPEYRGNHFSVDNAQNLMHRCQLQRSGNGYTVRRPCEQETTEMLTSTEQWFRPVNLVVGPDGGLYIVDMYRSIIEDYSAIPRYLQQLYVESLVAGGDRGRIWRLVADGPVGPRRFDLTATSSEELVARLSDSNAWWRMTAQRLLIERGDRQAEKALAALASRGATAPARLHALYALDGLGMLRPEQAEAALADPQAEIRVHALRLVERWLDQRPSLRVKVVGMVDDPDPGVRLQLGFTLGESTDPAAVEALFRLAVGDGEDRWVQAAVLSSAGGSAEKLLGRVLAAPTEAGRARALVDSLALMIGARRDDRQMADLLAAVADAKGEQAEPLQVRTLRGLLEGLGRGKSSRLDSQRGQAALRRLLIAPSAEVRQVALDLAGAFKLEATEQMKAAYQRAVREALDENRDVQQRREAVATLAGAPYELLWSTAQRLLDPREPLELQLAAVATLAQREEPEVGALLLAGFRGYSPNVQAAATDAVFGRRNRLPALLVAMEEGRLPISALDRFRRLQLLENAEADVRRRAEKLLGREAGSDRKEIVIRYQAALGQPRDPARGEKVYQQQCAKCHRLQEQGFQVGPDLSAINNRPDETLVADVMDPSNQITVGYRNYTVLTEDGRIFTGVLAAETATSITLRQEEGKEETILRKDIDEMEASPLSMMPEDLEKQVTPTELADLVSYLRKALGPVPPPMLTLFEDDAGFADLLAEGTGRVSVRTDGPFSGLACLAVTPPQRWSLKIPGWNYPIRENPQAGQFRYLRFAWRSRGGEGVMIELADEGRWPPAEKPLRRYYAGKNTTGWAAVQVAEQAPGEWIVVTCDLWKDFGPFTLTGVAPTAMGGEARFDKIQLLRTLDAER